MISTTWTKIPADLGVGSFDVRPRSGSGLRTGLPSGALAAACVVAGERIGILGGSVAPTGMSGTAAVRPGLPGAALVARHTTQHDGTTLGIPSSRRPPS